MTTSQQWTVSVGVSSVVWSHNGLPVWNPQTNVVENVQENATTDVVALLRAGGVSYCALAREDKSPTQPEWVSFCRRLGGGEIEVERSPPTRQSFRSCASGRDEAAWAGERNDPLPERNQDKCAS